MAVSEMSGKELRAITPTHEQLVETVDYLWSLGWRFVAEPRADKPPYTWGWWTHPDHPQKNRPAGDPGNIHFKAWDTLKAYVSEG